MMWGSYVGVKSQSVSHSAVSDSETPGLWPTKLLYPRNSPGKNTGVSQFSSVVQSCLDCSTTGLPVHHQLLKPTQTHVHCVGDTIQPSHSLFSSCHQSFSASGSFQMSQLFASCGQSVGISVSASVIPMNTQDGLVGSPCSPRDSKSLLQHHSLIASILRCSAFSISHIPT